MAARIPAAQAGRIAAPVSEINVTPLVDVMLVLLIVFMVAAPLMAQGVKVDLPTAKAKPLSEDKPPVAISLKRDGSVYVDKTQVSGAQLVGTLTRETSGDHERRVEIRGDKGLPYGNVLQAMGEINEAGFTKIALVSEPAGAQ
ncbi:protein TolR [Paraburkholderia domus]|uniref:protein TolR n=1 Tax=Paraburkholderia domus TaxID=2793075 RepID=UPI0019129F74|nr:protein TolR [Paraburkholderia domus]MBK5066271.1 protein TolR [Burkholderia sp. R-70199]MBK5125786.1 protein TolR [Burkholderia sp. R-69980]CAE6716710.1 Biopolymer transport protein ExbD [Paraburkholderia domus]CAE6969204.1 Biopolymer transport protein ExbD [Paraburkholderia domus]